MNNISALLPEELQEPKFYLNNMSMFLQSSYGIEERFMIYFNILKNVLNSSDELIFQKLNIFSIDSNGNPNYFKTDDEKIDMSDYYLDMIGNILGISRTVLLVDLKITGDDIELLDTSSYITLDNYNFALYIQATLLKKKFTGSLIDLRKIYTGSVIKDYDPAQSAIPDLDYMQTYLSQLNIKVYSTGPAEALYIFQYGNSSIPSTADIQQVALFRMFYSGILTIESLGITYTYQYGQILYINGRFYNDGVGARFYGVPYIGQRIYTFYVGYRPDPVANGSISYVINNDDNSITYTASANEGYHFVKYIYVIGETSTEELNSTFTLSDYMSIDSITAVFEEDTQT